VGKNGHGSRPRGGPDAGADGKVREIEAVGFQAPLNSPSGWENSARLADDSSSLRAGLRDGKVPSAVFHSCGIFAYLK
jgi:hypothetical protein